MYPPNYPYYPYPMPPPSQQFMPVPQSKGELAEALRTLRRMKKYLADEKKEDEDKKKKDKDKDHPKRGAMGVIEMFIIFTILTPPIGIGYVWLLAKMLAIIGIKIN